MQSPKESIFEEAALAWLESLGYSVLHRPDIATGMPVAERSDPNYRDVVLEHNRAVHQCPGQRQFTLGEHG